MIEAIMGIVILSFSLVALLELNNTTISMLEFVSSKGSLYQDASLMSETITKDYNKKTKSAYDLLSLNYNIDNLDIKQILSQARYEIKVDNFSQLEFADIFTIDIQKISLSNKKNKIQIYKLVYE
ncbi:MAG: hypothetical protein DRG11_07015 [Epsilonproteobacteria bacterium]|nr:MAG: hypothetical protein DRG11_07015 [Campylobacterota bacterium]